ncbi:MAG: hypothetical protein R3C28_03590 [Pirellulaceae bacterium]
MLPRNASSRWLSNEAKAGKSPRTRNSYLQALQGFCTGVIDTTGLQAIQFPRSLTSEATNADNDGHSQRTRSIDCCSSLSIGHLLSSVSETIRVDNPQGRRTWTKEPLTFDSLPTALERAREALKDNPDFIVELERRGEERERSTQNVADDGFATGRTGTITVGQVNLDSKRQRSNWHRRTRRAGKVRRFHCERIWRTSYGDG